MRFSGFKKPKLRNSRYPTKCDRKTRNAKLSGTRNPKLVGTRNPKLVWKNLETCVPETRIPKARNWSSRNSVIRNRKFPYPPISSTRVSCFNTDLPSYGGLRFGSLIQVPCFLLFRSFVFRHP